MQNRSKHLSQAIRANVKLPDLKKVKF